MRKEYILAALLALVGCSKPFEFSNEPLVWYLAPTELKPVNIDHSSDYYLTGREALMKRQYNVALAHFYEAAQQNTNQHEALLGVATSYSLMGHFAKADQYFKLYRKQFGETVPYLNDNGFSLLLRGDYERAERQFLAAQKLEPSSLTIKNNLIGVRKLREAKS